MRIFLTLFLVLYLTGCANQPVGQVLDPLNDSQPVLEGKKETEILLSGAEDIPESEPIAIEIEAQPELINIPSTYDTDLAFAAQSPFGKWDLPYQEACEEASLITVAKHFNGQPLNNDIMDREIQALVAWQTEQYGFYSDTSGEEVLAMAQAYFGLNGGLVYEVTEDRIKQELVKGNLIVAPFAGRLLGNKFYTAPGPLYHMLVIRGYDRNDFITNDVGTRHGERYKYKYQTLINAIHDLPVNADGSIFRPYDDRTLSDEAKAEKIKEGRKVMIVFTP